MIECSSCHRHFRTTEDKCPFCARPSRLVMALNLVGGAVTTVILAACYGGPDSGYTKYTGSTGNTGDTGLRTTTTNDSDTGAPTMMSAPDVPLIFVDPEEPGTCDLEGPTL